MLGPEICPRLFRGFSEEVKENQILKKEVKYKLTNREKEGIFLLIPFKVISLFKVGDIIDRDTLLNIRCIL